MDKRTVINSSLIMFGVGSAVFSWFCPSWYTVASPYWHEDDVRPGNIRRIRFGEIASTIIVMGLGILVGDAHKSRGPILAAAGICTLFVVAYEYRISHPPVDC